MSEAAAIAILVPVIYVLIEVVKYLINRRKPASPSIDEIKGLVEEIYDVNKKTDTDGRPLVYFPQAINETQKEIVQMLWKVSESQERISESQKHIFDSQLRIMRIVEKLENRVETGDIIKRVSGEANG